MYSQFSLRNKALKIQLTLPVMSSQCRSSPFFPEITPTQNFRFIIIMEVYIILPHIHMLKIDIIIFACFKTWYINGIIPRYLSANCFYCCCSRLHFCNASMLTNSNRYSAFIFLFTASSVTVCDYSVKYLSTYLSKGLYFFFLFLFFFSFK